MFNFKKSSNTEAKFQKEAKVALAELEGLLQDTELQIISYTHNRNALIEKINYFKAKLPVEVVETKVEKSPQVVVVDKDTNQISIEKSA